MWHRRMRAPRTPDRAVDLAARHEVVVLVNANPALWPLLNEMTLIERPDWPAVLNRLLETTTDEIRPTRHRRAAGLYRSVCSECSAILHWHDADRGERRHCAVCFPADIGQLRRRGRQSCSVTSR